MLLNRDICNIINTEWKDQFSELQNEHTFPSRLLYPFAKCLIDNPALDSKIIFISDTSWFKKFLAVVDIMDCIKQQSDPFHYTKNTEDQYIRFQYPQNIGYMVQSLRPRGFWLRRNLSKSLYHIFRTRSVVKNFFGRFDRFSSVPYMDLDVFVTMCSVSFDKNLIKVCIGGLGKGVSRLLKLATKVKFYQDTRFEFHKDPVITFYKQLYLDKKTVFDSVEVPWIVDTTNDEWYKPIPILSAYIDLNREKFLQETLLGKLMFSWYRPWLSRSHADIQKLEEKMFSRFPELTTAFIKGTLPVKPNLY